jgi:phosphohistidine phosphatase
MKTLIIMRHAKAISNNPDYSDFERPLTQYGLKATIFIGNIIYQKGLTANLIIASPTKRAKQTAVLVKETAELNAKIEYREEIYGSKPKTFFQLISEVNNDYNSIILIGHNPEIEYFIGQLTGEIQFMPTSSIAIIKLSIQNWSDITINCGWVEELLKPRELMDTVDFEEALSVAQ